jgi:hypothetical protein
MLGTAVSLDRWELRREAAVRSTFFLRSPLIPIFVRTPSILYVTRSKAHGSSAKASRIRENTLRHVPLIPSRRAA